MEEANKGNKKSLIISLTLFLLIAVSICLFVIQPWGKRGDLKDIDYIDLTSMNSIMVYGYVNDMINNSPEEYLGKTIKASGSYSKSYSSTTENYYHFILISDAMACCAQGIEFRYGGEYPQLDAQVTIIGTFEKYDELGKSYYYINATDISIT